MKSTLPSLHTFRPTPGDEAHCAFCARTRDAHRPAPVEINGRLHHDDRCIGDDEHDDACICGLDD